MIATNSAGDTDVGAGLTKTVAFLAEISFRGQQASVGKGGKGIIEIAPARRIYGSGH